MVETAPVAKLFSSPNTYTKKLIAASPEPNSHSPSSLLSLSPHSAIKLTRTDATRIENVGTGLKNILEVFNLVKEFPIQQASSGLWSRVRSSQTDRVFRAVDDISFSLKRGESLGLVGESGCGKSTTSSIITRLINPTSGDIIFDGENITTYAAESFARRPERKKIQMVFQDPENSIRAILLTTVLANR